MTGLKTIISLIISLVCLHGCGWKVMPTPNLYTSGEQPPFGELAPELKSNHIDLFYVTDRVPEKHVSGSLKYGYQRSPSIAYGSAIVELGNGLSWEELVTYSTSKTESGGRLPIKVVSFNELGKLPATPYLFRIEDGVNIKLDPEIIAAREEAISDARRELVRRLALTPRKELYIFVHGVGTSFDDAMIVAAQGWHFLGREGVPIPYTWPAGRGGLFFYGYDRESGEFTGFHLKQTFKVLASMPEVEKIHVVAHSRGTQVVMEALRELVIESRAAGMDPREQYKFENVILLAPDIDFEVAMQRLVAEAMGPAVGRYTIYVNRDDNALSAASTLLSSRLRFGALSPTELTDAQREAMARGANLNVIAYEGAIGGRFGHRYFVDNPAVSSDILALLRYGHPPGEGARRPLKKIHENMWIINDQYLLE